MVAEWSGKVFQLPLKGKPGDPMKELWDGKDPVQALIHDTDKSKWYAFTRNVYFEIAPEIKPLKHTLTVNRTTDAIEAIQTAAQCGRVIRGIPEPKPSPKK